MAFNEQSGVGVTGVVHNTMNEEIDGVKTFNDTPIIPDEEYGSDWNGKLEPATKNAVYDEMETRAVDADVVHKTGAETVAGVKTFSSDPIIPDEVYGSGWNGVLEPPTKNAVYDQMELRAVDTAVVHKTGAETIAGVKTFSDDPIIPDEAYGPGWDGSLEPATKNAIYDKIEALEAEEGAVHTTGDETVAGVKTFTSDPIIPDEVYGSGWNGVLEPPTKNAVYDKMETKADDANVVHKTGNETVGGIKTFSDDPLIPDEAYSGSWNGSLEPPTKNAVYDQMETRAVDSSVVHKTGNETVGGVKTFSSDPLIPDEVYSGSWDGVLEPPTKNAVYDKMETKADDTEVVHITGNENVGGVKTFTDAPIVPDEAYDPAWDGSLEPPTKNAVYDKLEAMLALLPARSYWFKMTQTGGSDPSVAEEHLNTLGGTPVLDRPVQGTYTITLLNAFTVGKTNVVWGLSAKHGSVEVTQTSASVLTITVKGASGDVALSDLEGSLWMRIDVMA